MVMEDIIKMCENTHLPLRQAKQLPSATSVWMEKKINLNSIKLRQDEGCRNFNICIP